MQHAREFGIADRLDDVIHATTHNLSYDPQCEGDRGEWMLGLLDAAEEFDRSVGPLITPGPVDADGNEDWHKSQRATVFRLLAQRGCDGARESLYRHFDAALVAVEDFTGMNDIIDIDGELGLLYVCRACGGMLQRGREHRLDEEPLEHFDASRTDGAARAVLESARESDAAIDAFLIGLDKELADGRASRPVRLTVDSVMNLRPDQERIEPRRSYESVVRWIEGSDGGMTEHWGHGFWLMSWGRKADESELVAMTSRLRAADTAWLIFCYLRIFARRSMPGWDADLLHLLDHAHDKVRWAAHMAFRNVANSALRRAALERLRIRPLPDGTFELFQNSHEPGDHVALECALPDPASVEDFHGLGFDLVRIFDDRPLAEARDLMLYVYEHSPCSNCRATAVEVMVKSATLPAWVAAECSHDSSDHIRGLVALHD